MKKRIISVLLAITMIATASSIPTTGFASERTEESIEFSAPDDLVQLEDGSLITAQKISVQAELLYKEAFQVLDLVNKERAKANIQPLKMDRDLLEAAMLRAQETALSFSHTRPTGQFCESASDKMSGENIAVGSYTADNTMNQWMNSPMHKDNILAKSYNSIGVGVAVIGDTCYWVQCFGEETADEVSEPSYSSKQVTSEILFSTENKEIVYGVDKDDDEIFVKKSTDVYMYFYNGFVNYEVLPGNLLYTSSNKNICTVDAGKVVGVGKGTAKITVCLRGYPDIKGETNVRVISKKKQTISGTSSIKKAIGSRAFYLNAKAKGKLSYKTGNKKVLTVNSKGKVSLKGIGRTTITVTAAATSKYDKETKKVTVTVTPKKVTSVNATAGRKKMSVSWKKDNKVSGYQIVYAQNRKFTKGKKTVTVNKSKTIRKTIGKLKSKKTYYVKIRAYKKSGKTKIYGAYSAVKKIKVK